MPLIFVCVTTIQGMFKIRKAAQMRNVAMIMVWANDGTDMSAVLERFSGWGSHLITALYSLYSGLKQLWCSWTTAKQVLVDCFFSCDIQLVEIVLEIITQIYKGWNPIKRKLFWHIFGDWNDHLFECHFSVQKCEMTNIICLLILNFFFTCKQMDLYSSSSSHHKL